MKPDAAGDRSFVGRTVAPIGIVEVGNQILTPLLAGLENSRDEPGVVGDMMKGLKTQLPLGNSRYSQASFHNVRERRKPAPEGEFESADMFPRYTDSNFTKALATLHDQVVDIGKNLGQVFDPLSAVPGTGSISERVIADKNGAMEALTPEKLPKIRLAFYKRDEKADAVGSEPLATIEVENIRVGARQRSLAHLLTALELAGDSVVGRNRTVGDFMWEATGGFVSTLPPLQAAVQKYLAEQLRAKGYDAEKVLAESRCDLDRKVVRETFDQLLPYAELYELSSRLRGDEGPDYVQKAFRQMRKYCSAEARDVHCEEGYQAGQLLEGMINHAIGRASKQERASLEALRAEFHASASKLLQEAGGVHVDRPDEIGKPVASVENVMALPQAQRIIEAFADCYAADVLLDKPQPVTEAAWKARVRLPGGSNTPGTPA